MQLRILALTLCLATPVAGQEPVPLTRGRAIEGDLARSDTNRYALALGTRQRAFLSRSTDAGTYRIEVGRRFGTVV